MPRFSFISTISASFAGALFACSSSSDEATTAPAAVSEELVLRTTPITLEPSQERYVCWDVAVPGAEDFPAGRRRDGHPRRDPSLPTHEHDGPRNLGSVRVRER